MFRTELFRVSELNWTAVHNWTVLSFELKEEPELYFTGDWLNWNTKSELEVSLVGMNWTELVLKRQLNWSSTEVKLNLMQSGMSWTEFNKNELTESTESNWKFWAESSWTQLKLDSSTVLKLKNWTESSQLNPKLKSELNSEVKRAELNLNLF